MSSVVDHRGNSNGTVKGEWVRWAVALILAALVAFGTAQTQIAVVDERENNHFEEILRRLDRIERKL